jgi:transcriptional regulator with XRE-family HTH domain
MPDRPTKPDEIANRIKDNMARVVRALMDERGWTQTDLARASGVSQKSVSNLLSRTYAPQLESLERIAQAFGVPAWALMAPEAVACMDPSHPRDSLVALARVASASIATQCAKHAS